jgi:hypothetical protein
MLTTALHTIPGAMSRRHGTPGGGRPNQDDANEAASDVLAFLSLDERVREAISPDLARLFQAMTERDPPIPVASQLEFARLITGVKVGSAYNGYTMAKLQGKSRSEAREQPATQMLLDFMEFLGADGPGTTTPRADNYHAAYESAIEALRDSGD